MTLGTDWQLSSCGGETLGQAFAALITFIPRFIIGIDVQFGL